MRVSELPASELRCKLGGEGLRLKTGPFVVCLQSSLDSVFEAIRDLYADFPIAEQDTFIDFHASVKRPRGIRRWIRPQALFESDGEVPFFPMPLRLSGPMLEWGLNWCVAARAHRYLMIHAAVLERGGKALLIPAQSGTGKSTLCAALCWRGWRLLTDELGLVCKKELRVIPFPRPVGLKDVSIDVIRSFESGAWISREWPDTTKGTIAHMRPPTEAVTRANEHAIPSWVVFLKYQQGSPVSLEPVPRSRAFLRIAGNSINYSLLGREGFETVARLVDATSCYDFTYGNLDEAVSTLNACTQNGGNGRG